MRPWPTECSAQIRSSSGCTIAFCCLPLVSVWPKSPGPDPQQSWPWLQRPAAWHCAAMPRTRADGRLGLNALQGTRSGLVTNSAHTLDDVGPAVHAALLRNMDGLEYNAMRLASAEPALLAKWMRVALKVKSLKDLPLPTHAMTLLLEASCLEFCRVNKKPSAQCMLQRRPARVS